MTASLGRKRRRCGGRPNCFLDRVVPAAQLLDVARDKAAELARLDMSIHTATKLRARGAALKAVHQAIEAATSTPAVYESFGDKAGLVRELLFEGFRMLRRAFDAVPASSDPRGDLERVMGVLRKFVRDNPALAEVMFSRPFADFDPGPSGLEAGDAVRTFIVGRVRRCIDTGVLTGNETDIAHVLISLTHGLAATEMAGWLGTSKASVDRRWALAIRAVLDGMKGAAG